MEKKAKKRIGLWIALAAVVVVACVAVILLLPGSSKSNEQAQPAGEYTIYWNVDRQLYLDAETGLNNREPNGSGYYPLTLSFDGQQKEFLVADKPLISKMDRMDMFGIVRDEDGIIIDVLEIEAFTGGTVAKRFYVESVSEDSFTANSSKTLKGESATFSLAGAKVYSVVGEGLLVGMPSQLRKNDRIIGVVDLNGNLTHVYVVETLGPTQTRFCDHCEMEVDWTGWTKEDAAPSATGHYFLMNNVQLSYQLSIPEEQAIVLDLNGYTITGGEDRRVFSLHNPGVYLGIMDYSETRTGKVEAWGQGAHVQGGCVWVRYGIFELFSGTLDASRMRTDLYGVALHVNKETTANIYGGTIIGGTSVTYTNPNTGKKSGAQAGAVQIEGEMNMSGGLICDGKAEGYIDTDGSYKRGNAGNVLVSSSGTLNMTGGSILNGQADGDGGNLYVSGTVNISGDVIISGGTAKQAGKRGGNILVGSAGNLTMTGGKVTGGTSGGSGGNIYSGGNTQWIGVTITGGKSIKTEINNISAYRNTCLLQDCTVDGDVYAAKECKLTLAGATQITKGENYGLKVTNEVMIEPGQLSEGANIVLTATGYFTNKTNTAAAKYFKLSCEGGVLAAGGRLFAGKRYCLCGGKNGHESYCDGSALLWQAWTDKTKMPTAEGNFYLTANVKLSKRATVGKVGGTENDARNIRWDLNGCTITGAKGSRVAFVTGFSTLSICDTKGGGKLQAVDTYTENGHTVFGGSNTTINIYGGTVTGGNIQAILKATVNEDGTETVKGANGQGGNLYTYGVLNMYGGTITGGIAKAAYDETAQKYYYGQGGNVALSASGEFHFYGGTISDGMADQGGGNLYVSSPVTMHEGAVISGGSLAMAGKSGGNVYLNGTCVYDMQGGTITLGTATSNGGNVVSYGQFNLSGGEVTLGTANNLGGNICVGGSGAGTISGGTVTGGVAKIGTDENGNVIVDGTAASANIIAMKDSIFTITGGQLAEGVRVINGCVFTLGGSPVIEGISLGGNVQAAIDGLLGESANIVLDKDNNGYFAVTQEASNADKFMVQEGYLVDFDQEAGMLQIISEPVISDHEHCLCAGNAAHICENTVFAPWGNTDEEKTSLPTSGSYYLTADIVLTDPGSGTGICKVETSLDLCLNGYTITTASDCMRRIFHVANGGTLRITDCSENQTGTIAAGYETYTAEGGLVLVGSNSTLNLYAGTLSGTNLIEAGKNGGTLRSYGTINIYGGVVTGGTAVNGGNIAAGGPLNIYGGTITGGIATGNGGNIWISSSTAAILVSNCEITSGTAAMGGGLYVNGNVKVSGDLKITGNTGSNLYVPEGKRVAVEGALGENALVYVTATGVFATTDVEENAPHFKPDDDQSVISFADNTLAVTTAGGEEPQGHSHCICAGNENHTACADVTWTGISGDISSLDSGYYFLEGPVNLTGSITIGSGKDVYICLNGQTMTAKDGQRAFLINGGGQLHIADCGENGKLTGNATTATANLNGGVIFVMKGTLELFGGTVESLNTDAAKAQNGGTIRVGNTATNTGIFRMYGGTVTGGVSQKGGNIYVRSGTFEMLGGLITGGTATSNGDNLFIQNSTDAVAILSGGTIHGGVYLEGDNGTLTITGTITEE